jgi:serine/threonine protein phosphatase 1
MRLFKAPLRLFQRRDQALPGAPAETVAEDTEYRPVLRFSRNLRGTDYVVGDIHGEFRLLEAALRELAFDPARDRLFSVGDLIDRGPSSQEALDWLARPWFHAIRGNHEAMALDAQHDEQVLHLWTGVNGGGWWLRTGADLRRRLLAAFARMPLAIEVAGRRGRVGIVHADVPLGLGWDELLMQLERADLDTEHYVLWSRRRASRALLTPVPGVGYVFCGHCPIERPTRLGNVYFIDTGACYGRALTLLPLDEPEAHVQGGLPDR